MPNSPHTGASSRADRKARIRPAAVVVAIGGLVGIVGGASWLGGTVAEATTVRAQAERIKAASSAGFTEEALSAAAGGLDASALAIARRHDPYTVAGPAQRDRQAELMTARLEKLRTPAAGSDLRRVSATTDAARPFRLGGALDQSRDLECLTQAAYYEARGEGRDGMQAVAQVVLNRARHSAFPNTVCGVVYQGANRRTGCQFSFTCNGSMRGAVNRTAWNRARDVASQALSGQVYAAVGNATHFHTTGVSPGWRNRLVRVNQVGTHLFYRFGGRSGSGDAFRYSPRPSSAPEFQRVVHAGVDPSQSVRQAGQAIAYTVLLAQDGLADRAEARASESAARSATVTESTTTPAAVSVEPRAETRPTAAPPTPTPAVEVKVAPIAATDSASVSAPSV